MMYAYTLTVVIDDPSTLVRHARLGSGLSIRALAARAGVAATTITRIESGRIDPTVGTLRSILGAAGRELRLDAPRRATIRLADLTDAWADRPDEVRPDWTRLRAALDHLALQPDETADAIATPPGSSGSDVIDALLAGIADKLADDHHLARPAWTATAPDLEADTFLMPATPRQRAAIKAATPHQLATRRLFVDEATLWRQAANGDA